MKFHWLRHPSIKYLYYLSSNNLLSIIIIFIATPILTRLYTPYNMGILAAFIALASPVSVIANFRLENLVTLKKSSHVAEKVLLLCLYASLFFGAICICIIFFAKEQLLNLFNITAMGNWIYLMPVSMVLSGFNNAYSMWAIRLQAYKTIAKMAPIQTLLRISTQILLGILKPGAGSLIISCLFSQVMLTMNLARLTKKLDLYIKKKHFQHILYHHWRGASILTTSGILNGIGLQLPTFFILHYYGLVATGFYLLADRVLSLPAMIFGNAIGQVFFGVSSQKLRAANTNIKPIMYRFIETMLVTATLPAFIFIFMAPPLFDPVFGIKWHEAGTIAAILTPVYYTQLFAASLAKTFIIYKKPQYQLLWDSIRLIALSAIFIGYGNHVNMVEMMKIYSFVMSLLYCGLIISFMKVAQTGDSIHSPSFFNR